MNNYINYAFELITHHHGEKDEYKTKLEANKSFVDYFASIAPDLYKAFKFYPTSLPVDTRIQILIMRVINMFQGIYYRDPNYTLEQVKITVNDIRTEKETTVVELKKQELHHASIFLNAFVDLLLLEFEFLSVRNNQEIKSEPSL